MKMMMGGVGGGCNIEQLPDDILSYVLLLLDNMREAVRARVLSRRWRHLFPTITNLNLDVSTLLGIPFLSGSYTKDYYIPHSDSFEDHKFKFVKGLGQVFQLYNGCGLRKIDLVQISFCARDDIARHVDTWVGFAVAMDAETIQLNFSVASPEGTTSNGGLYSFPCHLLSRGDSSRLKHLSLGSCFLRPSIDDSRDRFCFLKTLDLFDTFLDDNDVANILSGCLNLVSWRLQDCSLPSTLRISAKLPSLKKLFMRRCTNIQNLVLKCDALQILECVGEVIKFIFSDVFSLEKVILMFAPISARNLEYMLCCLAKDLPQLCHLKILIYCTRYCCVPPERIPSRLTTFGCLRILELNLMYADKFDLLSVTFLLNASPFLQKFHLGLLAHYVAQGRVTDGRGAAEQFHCQLKEVEISGFRDRWNEMELARYLLKNAMKLERMVIDPRHRIYRPWDTWTYSPCSGNKIDLTRKRIHDLLSNEERGNPGAELVIA